MNSGTIFNVILGIFYFFGMCPISLDSNASKDSFRKDLKRSGIKCMNILLVAWSTVSLVLLTVLILVVFTNYSSYFGAHNYISEFNDLIKLATVYGTHFTVLVEAIFSRHHLQQFWQKINEVDSKIFSQLEVVQIHTPDKFNRRFIRKFLLNLIAVIAVEVTIISMVQKDSIWAGLWYISCVSLLVGRLRHMHLMLHVDMIGYRLRIIRKELEQVVSRSQSTTTSLKQEAIEKRLLYKVCVMKSVYNSLFECCMHINFSFGFSQLSNLMQNFIQLTCDLYWIYSILYRNDLTYIFVLILTLVPTFQVVIVMLSSCEMCLKEVREIGFLLHNVEKDADDQSMDTLIENFSLQILHEPFYFSVTGFFNMDFTLLKAMVAAITTYMVIFIQFMPKEDPTKTATAATPLSSLSTTIVPFVQNVTALAMMTTVAN